MITDTLQSAALLTEFRLSNLDKAQVVFVHQ